LVSSNFSCQHYHWWFIRVWLNKPEKTVIRI
jgi:hypothetical protein